MSYAYRSPRSSDSRASWLAFALYVGIALLLMLSDRGNGTGAQIRLYAAEVLQPVWWMAASPLRAWDAGREHMRSRSTLIEDNRRLRTQLMLAQTRMHRLAAVGTENQRLRELLNGSAASRLEVQLVDIQQVDLNPARQRILLAAGTRQGVRVGQAVVDADGLLGQVVQVGDGFATALLITDTDHGVPVLESRTGLRLIAYGTGEPDRLRIPNIPQSAQLRAGDMLLTSGVGGRFPPGLPVATITALKPDESRSFVVAEALPAGHVDEGGQVLLVRDLRPLSPLTVPAPTPAPATNDAAPASPPETTVRDAATAAPVMPGTTPASTQTNGAETRR